MITVRRVVSVLVLLLLALVAYTAYQAWQVQRDLTRAQDSAQELVSATRDEDQGARNRALSVFLLSSKSANDRTDGRLWGALTHLPMVGDDVRGVRALSASLDTVATDGVDPLIEVVDDLDGITTGGQLDLDRIRAVQDPVAQSRTAFRRGYSLVADLDSSGYAGPLKQPFDDYVDQVGELSRALGSAAKATQVLPAFLGGDGARTYLMVFQNNAEIRATGGLPGSWAEVRADNGKAEIVRQGTGAGFGRRDTPVLPLSEGEVKVYFDLLGIYFQDANFTPDFPRAAELMAARWEETYSGQLDGVITIDPVAFSYLLEATGPVRAGKVRLTADNVVEELLNKPYLELEPQAQDAFFATAAKALFTGVTTQLGDPLEFVRGLSRAAEEGRFHIAAYDEDEAAVLAGTPVEGDLPEADTTNPFVYVGLNDATGSKMSYYLRYRTEVEAQGCKDNRQQLTGTMSLNQTIPAAEALTLPVSVTGQGEVGIERGKQLVAVRIYGPTGGDISDIKVDGSPVVVEPVVLDGRPVVTLVALLSGPDDALITWSMETGPGQEGDGTLGVTPGIEPGGGPSTFDSAC